jgi:hypothetical protein
VKREDLFFALNEATHALRFAESAAKRFSVDADSLEADSKAAASMASIGKRLGDAQILLSAVETEIGRLLRESGSERTL